MRVLSIPLAAVVLLNLFSRVNANEAPFRVLSVSSLTGNEIGICFNAAVDSVSGSDPRNYRLSDTNIFVTNAIVRADHSTVVLKLSRHLPAYSFVAIVDDVRSAAGSPLENHVVAGGVQGRDGGGFRAASIGSLPASGTIFACKSSPFNNDFNVQALGDGVDGSEDSFLYVYHDAFPRFAVQVRVNAPLPGHRQAGLIARKSLDPGSPFLGLLTFSTNNSQLLRLSTFSRDSNNTSAIPWPGAEALVFSSFPIWLRLEGDGENLSAFGSTNQTEWTRLGTIQAGQFSGSESFLVGAATVSDPNVLDQNETEYREYRIEPHGDIFLMPLQTTFQNRTFSFVWPSVFVVHSSHSVMGEWSPLTNHVESGASLNKASFEIPGPDQKRFFRLSFP